MKEKHTEEFCAAVAQLYTTRNALKKGHPSVYVKMWTRGWLDRMCGHMVPGKHGRIIHTDEDIAAAFKRHTTLGAVKRGSDSRYYKTALDRYGHGSKEWNTITAHMEPPNKFGGPNHSVYVFEFSDNHAYVGQSQVISKRMSDHLISGPVFEHIRDNPGVTYCTKILEAGITAKTVGKREAHWQKAYADAGWTKLWTAHAGAMGRFASVTFEDAKRVAASCKTRCEFWDNHQAVAKTARKRGWFDEITQHLPKCAPVSDATKAAQSAAAKKRPQRSHEQMVAMNRASQQFFEERRQQKDGIALAVADGRTGRPRSNPA